MATVYPRVLRKLHMVQGALPEAEKKMISIFKVLSEFSEPLGSITIARELERHGISLSERVAHLGSWFAILYCKRKAIDNILTQVYDHHRS